VYDRPLDTFVGGFIGTPPMNFIDAELVQENGAPAAKLSGGTVPLAATDVGALQDRDLVLGIRAENIEVHEQPGAHRIRSTVLVCEPLGAHNLLTVRVGEDMLKVATRSDLNPAPDSEVWLRVEPDRIRWMDRAAGTAIEA
jgi:multiple sugar transport system ATP-binding protein